MEFLNQLLKGLEFVPGLVTGIEGLFADRPGAQKKDAAMSFLEDALALADASAKREIVNPEQFKDGISRIVDGVVQCMNASAWAKSGGQSPEVKTEP